MPYKNIENYKAYIKEYRLKNKEIINKKAKIYYLTNLEKRKEYQLKYYSNNKNKIKQSKRLFYLKNIDKIKESQLEYHFNNKDKIKKTNRLYRLKKPHIHNALTAKRRATKLKATPKFANLNKIKEIYNNCPKGFHVDHIVPLTSKLVCGLHVEWNLQYLPAKENLSKSNKLM